MKKTTITIVFASLLMTAAAQAELVHKDYLNDGDQRITADTTTQLEWLKFNADRATMSITDIQAEMQAGGQYDGWRLPTGEEVAQLISSLLPAYSFNSSTPTSFTISASEASHAQSYLGLSSSMSGNRTVFSYGLHYRNGSSGTVSLTGVRSDSLRAYQDYSSYGDTYRHGVYNVYMVNDGASQSRTSAVANVTVPFLAIGTLGLVGLLGRSRRR